MHRTPVPEAASIAELRARMHTLTLPSGVPALARAGVSTGSGDAWFAGWTSHYTAAVRVTSTLTATATDTASGVRELFTAVLDPLQYPS